MPDTTAPKPPGTPGRHGRVRTPKSRRHGGVADPENLAVVLDALVPMTIHSMAGMDHADRMAMADVDAITSHADVLLAGGTSEPGCAYAPGGVTIYGRHWCVEAHEGCPNGGRATGWGF